MAEHELKTELKLFFLLLQASFYISHFLPEHDDIVHGVIVEHTHYIKRRSVEQSLRIKLHIQSSNMINVSSTQRSLIINKLLPDAVDYFGRTFKVRHATSRITLQRKCKTGRSIIRKINGVSFRFCIGECDQETKCGPARIPSQHLDVCQTCDTSGANCLPMNVTNVNGVRDADFVLYVTTVTTPHCDMNDDVIAYAAVCQQEESLDRPVAGFVNFCANRLTSDIHYNHLLAIVKHEIYHALGFSSALYGYYRDNDGVPLTVRSSDGKPVEKWSDKVVKEIVRMNWHVSDAAGSLISHKVEVIVTPRVLREVRRHFNCLTLEGAEIENQGRIGQKQTHWEKRLFENEAMTGGFTHNPVFSRITLALMEDTGWYKANYDMAENLDWGRNAGCVFAQNSCKAWMDYKGKNNENFLPFCVQVGAKTHTKSMCTHGYSSVGVCNLVKYNTLLPVEYQYFNSLPGVSDSRFFGGSVALADYCPFIQELDWKKNGNVVRGSNCKFVTNNLDFEQNYALEEYGPNSSCFIHGEKWTRRSCTGTVTPLDWGSGCYLYTCHESGIVLSIMGHSYPCFARGEKIEIKFVDKQSWLHKGSIICPACQDLCQDSCPFVQTKQFYNSTYNKQIQQALVCNTSKAKSSIVVLLISFFMYLLPYFFSFNGVRLAKF